jgi:hypothetical protein
MFTTGIVYPVRARVLTSAEFVPRISGVLFEYQMTHASAESYSPVDPYRRFQSRSVARSARALARTRAVLASVSDGLLNPAVFEQAYDSFIAARGNGYAARLADVQARFLAGLVRIGFPAESGETTPSLASDPTGWFTQLADRAMQLRRASVAALQTEVTRAARAANTDAPGVARPGSAAVLAQGAERLSRVTALYLDLIEGMSDVAAACEEDYFEHVFALAHGTTSAPGVQFAGRLGDAAETAVSIENTTAARSTVCCSVGDVRRADGVGPAFTPRVVVSPSQVVLEPGEDTQFHVTLSLDPPAFDSGAVYVGHLYVHRDGHPPLHLPMQITAAPPKVPEHDEHA